MRNVFFSHHYADAVLVQQIMNCHQFSPRLMFRNWREWERVRLRNQAQIKQWIDDELDGSTVTVVLIGEQTASRDWVHYEIERTVEKGNGLLGIHLNKMRGLNQFAWPRAPGANPFYKHPPRPMPEPLNVLAGLLAQTPSPPPPRNALAELLARSAPRPSAFPNGILSSARTNGGAGRPILGGGMLASREPSPTLGLLSSEPYEPLFPDGLLGSLPSTLAQETAVYCWEDHNGRDNIEHWIEGAAGAVGR